MPAPLSDLPPDLGQTLRQALDHACLPLLDGTPNGPALWRSIERTVAAALARIQASAGFIASRARCDAETNEGSPDAPVVEVVLRLPRRVREVVLRMTIDGGDWEQGPRGCERMQNRREAP